MTTRWRLILIALLALVPFGLLVVIGLWHIVQSAHWYWLPWVIPGCWGGAWLLLRGLRRTEVPLPEIGTRTHWTPHDHEAMAIITAEQSRVDEATPGNLIDPDYYRELTRDLSVKVARHYHPDSTDPIGSLSVVELLTLFHLVSEDLEKWFQEYVPGSHLITISQWKMLGKVPSWWTGLTNIGTLASVILDPSTIPRKLAMRGVSNPLLDLVRSNSLGAFCRFYIQRVGYYLIELHSGRLQGGSPLYRRTMERLEPAEKSPSQPETAPPAPVTVTIAVIGQVKAGKSSLINCLLGGRRAAVDTLPTTRDVTRYELTGGDFAAGANDHLVLLDTPGYSDSGMNTAQRNANQAALRKADLVLLVTAATSPAKQADREMLKEIRQWFESQHELKPPPVIGVLSKIDALSPLMEWAPPYDWEEPSRPKEKSISEAVQYTHETLGESLSAIVPVATDQEHSRVFGVEEFLMPSLALYLDDARAVSLVRTLHEECDQQQLRQVISQFLKAGRRITDAVFTGELP